MTLEIRDIKLATWLLSNPKPRQDRIFFWIECNGIKIAWYIVDDDAK